MTLFLGCASPLGVDETDSYESDPYAEVLHSAVPLFASNGDNVWPQSFSDDESFGCETAFRFGTWQAQGVDGSGDWLKIANYGVFHCALMIYEASEQDELESGFVDYAYAALLKQTETPTITKQLFALQIGFRPGSNYRIFAVTSEAGETIRLEELDTVCPKAQRRDGPNTDIWFTSYCLIDTKSQLRSMAFSAAKRPPKTVFVSTINNSEPEE